MKIISIRHTLIFIIFSNYTYGVLIFIKNAESPEKRAEGAKSILWGIVGMFIMVSVKGIINIILSTIGAI